jgi:putative oxidoreductase
MWTIIEVIARVAVGGILLAGGILKLSSTETWQQVWLASYRLLPRPFVRPVARTLPWIEVTCGAAMAAGWLGRVSAISAAALLLALTAAVAAALVRHLEIACGCFGRLAELVSWRVAGRNLALIVLAGAVAWRGAAGPVAIASLPVAVQVTLLACAVAVIQAAVTVRRARRRRRILAAIANRPEPQPVATPGEPAQVAS